MEQFDITGTIEVTIRVAGAEQQYCGEHCPYKFINSYFVTDCEISENSRPRTDQELSVWPKRVYFRTPECLERFPKQTR